LYYFIRTAFDKEGKEGKEGTSDTKSKFNSTTKYRFVISHSRLLDAKVRQLPLSIPNKASEKEFMDFPVNVFAKQLTYFGQTYLLCLL